jgi:hypothetical protein
MSEAQEAQSRIKDCSISTRQRSAMYRRFEHALDVPLTVLIH